MTQEPVGRLNVASPDSRSTHSFSPERMARHSWSLAVQRSGHALAVCRRGPVDRATLRQMGAAGKPRTGAAQACSVPRTSSAGGAGRPTSDLPAIPAGWPTGGGQTAAGRSAGSWHRVAGLSRLGRGPARRPCPGGSPRGQRHQQLAMQPGHGRLKLPGCSGIGLQLLSAAILSFMVRMWLQWSGRATRPYHSSCRRPLITAPGFNAARRRTHVPETRPSMPFGCRVPWTSRPCGEVST